MREYHTRNRQRDVMGENGEGCLGLCLIWNFAIRFSEHGWLMDGRMDGLLIEIKNYTPYAMMIREVKLFLRRDEDGLLMESSWT